MTIDQIIEQLPPLVGPVAFHVRGRVESDWGGTNISVFARSREEVRSVHRRWSQIGSVCRFSVEPDRLGHSCREEA